MSQKVQESPRLRRIAGSLSRTTRQMQTRIRQAQQAVLEERQLRKEEEERKLNRRIFLARRGARRLIAYGKTRSMQQIIRMNDRMGRDAIVPFFDIEWLWIGTELKREVSCVFKKEGVVIEAVDRCWVKEARTFTLAYSGKEVLWRYQLSGSSGEEEKCSSEQFLQRIATVEAVSLSRIRNNDDEVNAIGIEPTEDEVAFQFLISQSRKVAFEKCLSEYLERLEGVLNRQIAQAV